MVDLSIQRKITNRYKEDNERHGTRCYEDERLSALLTTPEGEPMTTQRID